MDLHPADRCITFEKARDDAALLDGIPVTSDDAKIETARAEKDLA